MFGRCFFLIAVSWKRHDCLPACLRQNSGVKEDLMSIPSWAPSSGTQARWDVFFPGEFPHKQCIHNLSLEIYISIRAIVWEHPNLHLLLHFPPSYKAVETIKVRKRIYSQEVQVDQTWSLGKESLIHASSSKDHHLLKLGIDLPPIGISWVPTYLGSSNASLFYKTWGEEADELPKKHDKIRGMLSFTISWKVTGRVLLLILWPFPKLHWHAPRRMQNLAYEGI